MLRILTVIKKSYFRQNFYYHVSFGFFITIGFLYGILSHFRAVKPERVDVRAIKVQDATVDYSG